MMFGTREVFDYFECVQCGTLQIAEIPEDMSAYYPADYFSLDSEMYIDLALSFARRVAARFAGDYLLNKPSSISGFIGKFIVRQKPWIEYHFPASLRNFPGRLGFDTRILDFGSGAGLLLQKLHYFGFRDLTGADAFIEADLSYPTGVKIYKKTLADLEPSFDLIMLHHSFEHLPAPVEALSQIHRLLSKDGTCLLRVPVVNFAWEKYGINWVQLDAPRHLFLYTEKSLRRLAEKAGFKVVRVDYDSTAFQFWGSEQYAQDMPLNHPRSLNVYLSRSEFTHEQIAEWQRKADELNALKKGDQACFYLRKM